MKTVRKMYWLLALCLVMPLTWSEALLTGIRASLDPDADKGTIEFRFNDTVFGDEKLLKKQQPVLRMDVLGASIANQLSIPEFPSDSRTPGNRGWPITRLHIGSLDNNVLRLELTMQSNTRPTYTWLERGGEAIFQVQVKLVDLPPPPLRSVVIAIDAGHGGRDPGAVGKGNSPLEKNITLAVSKRIAQLFNNSRGYRAYLVRSKDESVRLSERRKRATRNKADFYVSVHADAVESPQPSGASVYTLTAKGATNVAAKKLAGRENDADINLGGMYLAQVPDTVAQWMTEAIKGNNLERSKKSAELILQKMRGVTKIHGKGLEQANFIVLRGLEIPAVLVELGFISNRNEALALQGKGADKNKPEKLARAIVGGIKDYFSTYALPETFLAAEKSGMFFTEYRVQKDDYLNKLSKKFSVHTSAIKAANNLKSDTIKVGQILKIPTGQPAPQNPYTEYKVSAGDTISHIAAKFATTTKDIKRINGISGDRILRGQVLKIPSSGVSFSRYQVKGGDTLSHIAKRFSVRVSEIKSANGLKGDKIRPKQVLRIPQPQ